MNPTELDALLTVLRRHGLECAKIDGNEFKWSVTYVAPTAPDAIEYRHDGVMRLDGAAPVPVPREPDAEKRLYSDGYRYTIHIYRGGNGQCANAIRLQDAHPVAPEDKRCVPCKDCANTMPREETIDVDILMSDEACGCGHPQGRRHFPNGRCMEGCDPEFCQRAETAHEAA